MKYNLQLLDALLKIWGIAYDVFEKCFGYSVL